MAQDLDLVTNVARVQNRDRCDWLVAQAFAGHDAAQALAALSAADIAFAPVNDMAGLSAHPHLRRITVDTPNGPASYPAPGARVRGADLRPGPDYHGISASVMTGNSTSRTTRNRSDATKNSTAR